MHLIAPLPLVPSCLQDAHELFCGLLDLLQSEVLAREVRTCTKRVVHTLHFLDAACRLPQVFLNSCC